jgi:hypothetical protein
MSDIKLNSPVEVNDRFYLAYSEVADLMNSEGSVDGKRPWSHVDMTVTHKGSEYDVTVPFPRSAAQTLALGSEVRAAIEKEVGHKIGHMENVKISVYGATRGYRYVSPPDEK